MTSEQEEPEQATGSILLGFNVVEQAKEMVAHLRRIINPETKDVAELGPQRRRNRS